MVPADAGASLTHGFNYRFKLGAGVIRRDLDCRHRHPSHEQRTLGCSTYFRQPADALFWFRRARQPAFFDHCRAVFERHGYAPALLEEPEDHHVLLAAVASGRGVALLPASFAAIRRDGVIYKPLREGTELYVGIGLATSGDRSDVRKFLLRAARAR